MNLPDVVVKNVDYHQKWTIGQRCVHIWGNYDILVELTGLMNNRTNLVVILRSEKRSEYSSMQIMETINFTNIILMEKNYVEK